jgi:RNA polymerase sigma-70 factor (ECF subfamily)
MTVLSDTVPSWTLRLTDTEAAELVARMRAGDSVAFRHLFEAWFPGLVTLAYHYTGSSDTAHDIAQEAFVEFWNGRVDWRWTGSALGYLQLVVRRKSLKVLRRFDLETRRGTEFFAESISPTSAAADIPNDERIIRQELWEAVAAAVRRLPPRTRAVAVLRWFEGKDRGETAQELGVSVRTVDAQLIAAAKGVRLWLERKGLSE